MIKAIIKRYGLKQLRKISKEFFSLKANITGWIQDMMKRQDDHEQRLREVEAKLIKLEQDKMQPYRGFF